MAVAFSALDVAMVREHHMMLSLIIAECEQGERLWRKEEGLPKEVTISNAPFHVKLSNKFV